MTGSSVQVWLAAQEPRGRSRDTVAGAVRDPVSSLGAQCRDPAQLVPEGVEGPADSAGAPLRPLARSPHPAYRSVCRYGEAGQTLQSPAWRVDDCEQGDSDDRECGADQASWTGRCWSQCDIPEPGGNGHAGGRTCSAALRAHRSLPSRHSVSDTARFRARLDHTHTGIMRSLGAATIHPA